MSEPQVIQYIAELPDYPGAQALFRSWDCGVTWEVCTRIDSMQAWSTPRKAVAA